MNSDKIQEIAKRIAIDYAGPEASSTDKSGLWVEKSMQALKEAKLTGLVAPSSCGGLGKGLLSLVQVCEALGKECGSTGLCFGMHSVGTAVIAAKATDYQKKNFLEPIARGEHITTLALSEPGTGAHFYFPQTALKELSEDEYKIRGVKSFVTNGGHADSYVVSTLGIGTESPSGQFSCVVVPANSEGLSFGNAWRGLGMRGNSSIMISLNDVAINSNLILGAKGDQLWYVFNVVAPYFIMAMAGTYLGIAQAAIEEGINHIKSRNYSHSGTNLSQYSIIQHKLGTLWAKVEATRRLIYYAADEGDKGNENAVPAILAAKAEVGVHAVDIVNEVMTLTGGISYQKNSKLERLLRDARAVHVMSPTTDLLYTWIGRALLDQPILTD